ncbi:MAG: hypothetical protein ABI627_28570 [Polyangiaceae bacterium]
MAERGKRREYPAELQTAARAVTVAMACTPDEQRRGLVRVWSQYGELSEAGLLAGWFDWVPLFKWAIDYLRSPRRLRLVPKSMQEAANDG